MSNASCPPLRSIKMAAILLMKKPGAMLFTRMFLGPSSMARLRARCSTAALEAAYEYAPDSPSEPVAMPATEPVIMTREVSATDAFFDNRGVNLEEVSKCS